VNINDGKKGKIPLSKIATVLAVTYTVTRDGTVTDIRVHLSPPGGDGGVWDAGAEIVDADVEGSLIVMKNGETFLTQGTPPGME